MIFQKAIREGVLVRPSHCQLCNGKSNKAIEGHHANYSHPLEVVWCCRKCHSKLHRKGTIEEAAERSLYSKYRGSNTGLSQHTWIAIAKHECILCKADHSAELKYKRKGDTTILKHNFVMELNGRFAPACNICRELIRISPDIKPILRLAARILARRKWIKDMNWSNQ